MVTFDRIPVTTYAVMNKVRQIVKFHVQTKAFFMLRKVHVDLYLQLENEIQKLLRSETGLEEGKLHEVLPEAPEEVLPVAIAVLQSPAGAVGLEIHHKWSEDGQEQWFRGRVRKVKKGDKLQISYWGEEEEEEDSVDYDICIKQFIADLLLTDLSIVK